MRLQIEEVLKLQALDTDLGKLRAEMQTLDRGERVERALRVRQARLEATERKHHLLDVEQKAAELELRALELKKHEEARKLYEGRITAPRELQALEAEVRMLEKQRQRMDEQILRRMDDLERAEKALALARSAVEEAEKALAVVQRRYEKASKRIADALAQKAPERERLAAHLDPPVIRRYEEIRRRQHNLAAARIENGACGGCRMKVGGTIMRRVLAHEEYVYCESCTRFLFPSLDAKP
jgi:predicted  nucleic acid-binding Zn-ribbon protein